MPTSGCQGGKVSEVLNYSIANPLIDNSLNPYVMEQKYCNKQYADEKFKILGWG